MNKSPITGIGLSEGRVTFVLRLTVRFAPMLALFALRVSALGCLALTDRVLKHLATAEWQESDPWYKDDIRIAWLVTLEAIRGNPQAHTDATYRVLGCHPDEVFQRITERRKKALGTHYPDFFPDIDTHKKPSASVGQDELPRNARAKANSASRY